MTDQLPGLLTQNIDMLEDRHKDFTDRLTDRLITELRSYHGRENVTSTIAFRFSVLRLLHLGHAARNERSVHSLNWPEWFACKCTKIHK